MTDTPPERREHTLLAQVERGEIKAREAVPELIDIFIPLFMHYAKNLGMAEGDAEPIVQDAVAEAANYFVKFNATRTFPMWALMALRRRLLRARPSLAHVLEEDLLPKDPALRNTPEAKESAAVRHVLECVLPEPDTELIMLRFQEGRSPEEIAAATREPVSAVTEKLQRITTRFAELTKLPTEVGGGKHA